MHPVPWALLADTAITLVPGASVESVVLNDSTLNGETKINGAANVNGDLTVGDDPPILIQRYTGALRNNTTWSTGISAYDYVCTMGGWEYDMDINETGLGEWSRWLETTSSIKPLWRVKFYSDVHGGASDLSEVSVDVICFKNEITEVQTISSAAGSSDIAPDGATPDLTSSLIEVGQ